MTVNNESVKLWTQRQTNSFWPVIALNAKSTSYIQQTDAAGQLVIGLRTRGDEQILLRTFAVYEANTSDRQLGLTNKIDQLIHALFRLRMVQLQMYMVHRSYRLLTQLNNCIWCSPQLTIIITRSWAVPKTSCDCCVGQFWPNITGWRYVAEIIGLFSTSVT